MNEIETQLGFNLAPTPVVTDWKEKVPSVSQLTRQIRGHLEGTFLDIWVKGEVSNFRKPASGHVYFVLKDATTQLKIVMFRPQFSKIKFEIKDGMEIIVHGKITVYEARGEYQLLSDVMEPVGVGALQLAFIQLKEKLFKEGLFDPKHKKRLPALPKRIGVVTSPTGAAIKDILKVLSSRFPNLHILVISASVQGEKAPPEIAQGIQLAATWNKKNPHLAMDCLIVGRGGGSIEDLWCFNDERVARAIFDCEIPIISAVGHEIDFTIADFVADVRAATPSAAAEMIIPRKIDLQNHVLQLQHRMKVGIRRYAEQLRLHLMHMSRRLVDPRQKIRDFKRQLSLLQSRILQAMKIQLQFARKRLEAKASLLNTLSPLSTLGRGYSITRLEDGKIVRSAKEVVPGTTLITQLPDGIVTSVSKAT